MGTLQIAYAAAHEGKELEGHFWTEFMVVTDQRRYATGAPRMYNEYPNVAKEPSGAKP